MGDPSERRFSLGDFLFGQAREAIADIRGKLIDEGWFGRSTEPPGHDIWGNRTDGTPADLGQQPSFEEAWKPRSPSEAREGPEPTSHDIER